MVKRLFASRARRTSSWILSVLLVLVVFSNAPMAWAAEQIPVAKIVSVESPPDISPGENFTVVVAVDYSREYSTDIAILDAGTGFVLASKGLIIPAGRNLFTFSLTGRDRRGSWALVATVRVWWHDGWYANQKGGTFPFEITISERAIATLNIRSNLTLAVVRIDGISHSVSSNGLELSTEPGFHTIEVESPLILGNGTRVVFDHWSDGVRSSPRKIYMAASLDLGAIYLTEFFLTVKSSMSETVGSGWYPAGMNATFAVLDQVMAQHSSFDLWVTYKFNHWSGDSESTSPVGWVVMDRPKTVVANWSRDDSLLVRMYQLVIISLIFLSCSAMLIAIAVTLRRGARMESHYPDSRKRGTARGLLLVLFFLTVLAYSPVVQPANALTLLQPESITVGDAVWYHWNQAASDTLLIWLGGGIVAQSGFMVNPLEFESYNTVRFIQDLAGYYDVLALKKGSVRSVDPTLNKTVYGEPYPSSNNFMKAIRLWAHERGYTYLYVVGYSVGAMVAAEELVLANPGRWTSPDGLIIITTKISEEVFSKAGSLQASLLLLYGDKIAPEFTTSGERFFQKAPDEGWRDRFWFHKEYHVIPEVEHEVWTIRDTGEYDTRAVLFTVKFIETSKSLQFERLRESISRIALNLRASTEPHSSFNVGIASVKSPGRVRTREVFRIVAAVRYNLSSNFTVAVLTFNIDTASVVSAAERELAGSGEAQFITTLLSGESARMSRFTLIPLVWTEDGWTPVAEGIRDLVVDVTDSFAVTVIMGYPNVPVEFDAKTFRTGTDGDVTLNATQGEHLISVPSIITLGNTSRAVFQQWNDTLSPPTFRLRTSRDVSLLAIYRRQYYLSITSPFGQTTGNGWYDEDATAPFHVTPPLVVEQTTHILAGWSGDSGDSSPASRVFMNSSKNIRASWRDLERGERNETLPFQLQALFALSSATLLGSLIFAGMSFRRSRRRAGSAEGSPATI